MAEKTKKPKKVEVEKEFLETLLKGYTDLKKKVELFEKQITGGVKEKIPPQPQPRVGDKSDTIFYCMEIAFQQKPKSLQDIVNQQQKLELFRKELEALMRRNRIGQIQAFFLKKI